MTAAEKRDVDFERWRAGPGRPHHADGGALRPRSVTDIIRSNLFTRFNALLGALCVAVLLSGQWKDALFGGVLIANTAIGILQELRSRQKLAQLALLSQPAVRVRRSGAVANVAVSELVVGDLIELAAGDQITVDGVVETSDSLDVDESLLSGEAEAVAKAAGSTVMSGTFVVAGGGTYRATHVGADAYAHRLAAEAKRFEPTRSQLRAGIDTILRYVGWAIAPISLLLLVNQLSTGASVAKAVVFSAGGVVGMVPEGLVLLASVAMATGAMRLAKQKALVQELTATETLARIDVLCLDKTGTLTTGKPHFERIEMLTVDADAFSALGALAAADPAPNATLRAISAACHVPDEWHASKVVPFSSARKWAAATFDGRGTWYLGAPDVLLSRTASEQSALQLAAERAAAGYRVLLLASAPHALNDTELPEDLLPVALVLLAEEIQDDARATLNFFAQQGITVKVMSGDQDATVTAVAKQLGLPNAECSIDARKLADDAVELRQAMEKCTVFGRTSPHQKQAMVAALQANGHTVAMIGDGVNDVLALKQADIGIAMGSGSGAARAIAHLVLVDNRLPTLPSIVREGRRLIGNVERLANLFVTKTIYAMLLAIAVGIADLPFPFLPRHLTLIGALTIGIPAFLLSMESTSDRVRTDFIGRVLRFAIPAGFAAAIATFVVYFTTLEYQHGSLDNARSMATLALYCVATSALVFLSSPLNAFRGVSIAMMLASFVATVVIASLETFFGFALPSPIMFIPSALVVVVTVVVMKRLVDKLAASPASPGGGFSTLHNKPLTWRLVFTRVGTRNALVAVVLVIGGWWLFFGMLEDVVTRDPLVEVDVMIHDALQRMRFPMLDSLMVAMSELGDAAVTVPVIFVVLGWFVWRRQLRSALYWVAAVGLAQVFVETVKFVIRRPRPVLMYDGVNSFSFPSNHATLSVVTYGFLAFFVARSFSNAWRRRTAMTAGLLIFLISFSRLYLGVHWFSDVAAGVSFGIACIATAALLYHVGEDRQVHTRSLAIAAMVTFCLSAAVYIFMQHGADMIRYSAKAMS
ncbi:TPA: HAD-IC family P-type ATPase [Burkholderia vietnamiensis]|nr:HAD-IC family P-type ATPase [Burkholderia vietnamiensis]